MESVYLGCLFGGIFFALVSVVLGDWLSLALDGMLDFLSLDGHPILQPTAIVSGITVFGGTGYLLERHSSLGAGINAALAAALAVIAAIGLYFAYIRPMERSENSTGYSMSELVGTIGNVTVPLPAAGFGEVTIKVGAGLTNHIASSFDGTAIPAGAKVVVIEIESHTLRVSALDL